MSVFSLLD